MCKLLTLVIILLTASCAASSSRQPALCPLQCACRHQQDRHVIDCCHKNLTSLPFLCNFENDASGEKVEFYANGNKFRYILKSAFYHVRNRLSHLEITSNSFNIELAHLAFNSFVDSLEILKLEPVNENLNTLIDSLQSLNKLNVLHLTAATEGFQVLSSKFTHTKLTELSLQKCRIRNISDGVFLAVTGLNILNLRYNHLEDFPQELVAVVSKSVSVLSLSYNEITEVNEADIAKGCKLVYLDLSFNSIRFVEEGVLEKCVSLRFLNLSHNQNLLSLGRAVFDGLVGLHLDVSHSPISSLEFVKSSILASVLAFGTNLECSCDVQIKYMGALKGNLKGTCIKRLGVVDIQSKPLNCTQYKQRQKRIRFNVNGELEKSFDSDTNIATDSNRPKEDSGQNVHNKLYTSTEYAYLENSKATLGRSCNNKHCIYPDNTKGKNEGIVEHENEADIAELQDMRKGPLELSANTLRLSPSIFADSSLHLPPVPMRSEPIKPGPIRSEPIRSEPTSSFQASPVVGFEVQFPRDLPNGDTLASNVNGESDAKKQTMPITPQLNVQMPEAIIEVVDSEIEAPHKAVFVPTSMLEISVIMPESTSSFTPDMSSAKLEMPIATLEMSNPTPEMSSNTPEILSAAHENQAVSDELSIDTLATFESEAEIYSRTHGSHEQPAQTLMSKTSSTQTPDECGDRDRIIQPTITTNIINSISSAITYKWEYTYFINHVNHLNPYFSPPPKSGDSGYEEFAKESENSQPDAPSTPNGVCNELKSVPKEPDQLSQLDAVDRRQDGPTDTTRGYFFQGPMYVLACFVHACLLFVAFLKLEPGVKTKR